MPNSNNGYMVVRGMLRSGRRKIANNTYLTDEHNLCGGRCNYLCFRHSYCIAMKLHCNTVAEFHPNYIVLSSAGWRTKTTKDRLNLALQIAGLTYRIWQEDWEWYYGNNTMYILFNERMTIKYDGTVRKVGT